MIGYTLWTDVADKLDLLICDNGPTGCRKKWGDRIHENGRVDQIGVIHWRGWGKPTNRKGLYKVMLRAAYGKNRQFREEPEWLGLYHAATWAYATALQELDVRFRRGESESTRLKVRALMIRDGVPFSHYPHIYSWLQVPIQEGMIYASKKRRLRDKKVT
jgi:hypothetical protein